MNVVELEQYRKKEANRDSELVDALFFGMENSVHARDPDHPEEKGTLGRFMRHVADLDPRFYLSLLAKLEPPND